MLLEKLLIYWKNYGCTCTCNSAMHSELTNEKQLKCGAWLIYDILAFSSHFLTFIDLQCVLCNDNFIRNSYIITIHKDKTIANEITMDALQSYLLCFDKIIYSNGFFFIPDNFKLR